MYLNFNFDKTTKPDKNKNNFPRFSCIEKPG